MIEISGKSLFDDIFELSGLQYISDMSRAENRDAVTSAILRLDGSGYPEGQWRELSVYLAGRPEAFSCAREALEFLRSPREQKPAVPREK